MVFCQLQSYKKESIEKKTAAKPSKNSRHGHPERNRKKTAIINYLKDFGRIWAFRLRENARKMKNYQNFESLFFTRASNKSKNLLNLFCCAWVFQSYHFCFSQPEISVSANWLNKKGWAVLEFLNPVPISWNVVTTIFMLFKHPFRSHHELHMRDTCFCSICSSPHLNPRSPRDLHCNVCYSSLHVLVQHSCSLPIRLQEWHVHTCQEVECQILFEVEVVPGSYRDAYFISQQTIFLDGARLIWYFTN